MGETTGIFYNRRTIVIHDNTGARIACGAIQTLTTSMADMGVYPGQDTPAYTPSGQIKVIALSETSLKLIGEVENIEPNCEECGVHIHAGTSCDSADLVLGHFWEGPREDPWLTTYYSTDASGTGTIDLILSDFPETPDALERTVVLHDSTGARIACGVLVAGEYSIDF